MARKRRDSAAARGKSLERRIAEQERELTGRMAEKRRARRAAKDVYSAIGYDLLYRDGIAQVEEGLFSQTLAFDDISYQSAREENQRAIFSGWCQLFDYFGAESCVQLTVVNRPIPAEEIGAKEFFRPADPATAAYAAEYNRILNDKLREGVSVSATAKSAERATLSRRRRPRFPAGGATALWPPALPRAAAQGALDRGVVEVRGPDLNLQRRGALGVPGRDRPARDLPSAELREPDRHRDVLCAERGQPPRGVRGPHDCPLSGSPSPSAASASRSFMR